MPREHRDLLSMRYLGHLIIYYTQYVMRPIQHLIILVGMLLLPLTAQADTLTDLLTGKYNAKTMSAQEIDSVLNGTSTERYRLEYENKQQLFRHSFLADYYLIDTQKGTRKHLSDGPIRDAVLSPNGDYVVYAKADGNLYINKLRFEGVEVAITKDTNPEIFNGIADWLYEEEFGITGLFAFSPDSKMVAFVRLDETGVPVFQWQNYIGLQGQYPQIESLRYPKSGEKNASATVCVYDIQAKTTRTMQLSEMSEAYIPRIRWTNIPAAKGNETATAELAILRLNRDQNKMEVLLGNPKSTVTRTFYKEESQTCYVDYEMFDSWQWLQDNRVIVLSEKGGYTQAYLYSSQGMEQKLLTPEKRDITKLYGFDETTQTLYYQAVDGDPEERHAFARNIKKQTTTLLTSERGTHDLTFAKDYKHYVDCYQSIRTANRYALYTTGKQDRKTLLDNDSIRDVWETSGIPEGDFFTFTTERGDTLHGFQILPKDFDPSKRYPVVMFQYSGPASQRVLNRWRKRFEYYVATQGYVVVSVDGRGTNARGRAFRNASYMQLGLKEAEDQISTAQYMQTLPYVDKEHIAIVGWSYGGFEALMCLSKQPRVEEGQTPLFRCGIAIAPVTSWRLYDSAYTERYMRRPQVNDTGYDNSDLTKMAGELQGKLLIVHGLADDNVHAQHTLLYVDALVQAGKQFEMQIYPDDNHFLRKRGNYEHLHRRLMLFLDQNMK